MIASEQIMDRIEAGCPATDISAECALQAIDCCHRGNTETGQMWAQLSIAFAIESQTETTRKLIEGRV